jgi:hypothetical protein
MDINGKAAVMKTYTLRLVIAILLCMMLPACRRVRYLHEISQVTYTSRAGTILPEMQWYEEIVITPNQITLHRNGMTPDTMINEGDWTWTPDAAEVRAFFATLEAIDCSTIRRVEREPQEGGGTETYTIVYAGGKTFQFAEGDEVTYADSWLLWKPIKEHIAQMDMPQEAGP